MFKWRVPFILLKFRRRSGCGRRCQSSFTRIGDLTLVKDPVSVKGWVRSLRKMKDNWFVDVSDGSSVRPLQMVLSKSSMPSNLQYGSSVEAKGELVLNKNNQLEMQIRELEVIGGCELEQGYPFAPKKKYSTDYIRQYLHLRPRYSGFSSLFRIRHEATSAIHAFYREKGYNSVQTPILTSNDCEGAGEVFLVEKPTKKNQKPVSFFDDEVYLTVSGQLHLEVAARALSQAYCFGPTFRAENSKSRLHLSEFYMLEAETTMFRSLDELLDTVEDLVHYVTNSLISSSQEDLENCRKYLGDSNLSESPRQVEDMLSPFARMTYKEASDILLKNQSELKTKFTAGENFTKEQELFLVQHNNNLPVFVVEWPKKIKPFYMKSVSGQSDNVMAFDLLCPNVGEVCGGSFREDDYNELEKSLRKMKAVEALDWYLELRKFGNVTTCGYGLGFERYLQVLLQILNIKDVIPFPRWPHNCKL